MAMNRNRRRSEQSTHPGFWSVFTRQKREEGPINNELPEEFEPSTETKSGLGQWQWSEVERHIPFLLYCTILLLIYIANGHNQESMQRKILSTRKEVEDLKAEYILLQSEVMHLGRRTEVLDRLQNMGMGWKAPQDPPVMLDAQNEPATPKRKGT